MKKRKKRKSIRFQIILSFSLAMILTTVLTFLLVLYVSRSVLEGTIRNYLVSAVDINAGEIQYADKLPENVTGNIFIEYQQGYLLIDQDFLDEIHQVESGLYTSDGIFLYGKNLEAGEEWDGSFTTSHIYKMKKNETCYYIYDRKILVDGIDGLWIRGMVPLTTEIQQMSDITRVVVLFLPAVVATTILAGYLLSSRLILPIKKMELDASEISKGSDLEKRIDIGEGEDELHDLAEDFNAMIGRLNLAFESERRFTSDASHELRTPMAVIMAQTELVLEEERSVEEYQEALQVIRRQGSRMSGLIDSMLDYTRLEQRAEEYAKEMLDLSELVQSICQDMQLIRNKKISLDYNIQPHIKVEGNSLLLSRLIQNLIDNAYKYGKENGYIDVTLVCRVLNEYEKEILLQNEISNEMLNEISKENLRYRADGRKYSILCVKDNGIGIANAEQQKIFDRFYRVDTSRTHKRSLSYGYGLGLSMVKKIAEMHHAVVAVKSEEGKGSAFYIIFNDF